MDEKKEMTDERYMKDPFEGKVCPLVNQPCLKEKCMAYNVGETEWNDTVLEDERRDVDGVEVTMKTDRATGLRYKGKIHTCSAGIFDRKVTDVEIVEETVIEAPSKLILLDDGRG